MKNKGPLHLTVTVERHDWAGFMVTDENYEPGHPMGVGDTPNVAIKDYAEQAEQFYVDRCGYESFTYEVKTQTA
jgi:hypothetical protein